MKKATGRLCYKSGNEVEIEILDMIDEAIKPLCANLDKVLERVKQLEELLKLRKVEPEVEDG